VWWAAYSPADQGWSSLQHGQQRIRPAWTRFRQWCCPKSEYTNTDSWIQSITYHLWKIPFSCKEQRRWKSVWMGRFRIRCNRSKNNDQWWTFTYLIWTETIKHASSTNIMRCIPYLLLVGRRRSLFLWNRRKRIIRYWFLQHQGVQTCKRPTQRKRRASKADCLWTVSYSLSDKEWIGVCHWIKPWRTTWARHDWECSMAGVCRSTKWNKGDSDCGWSVFKCSECLWWSLRVGALQWPWPLKPNQAWHSSLSYYFGEVELEIQYLRWCRRQALGVVQRRLKPARPWKLCLEIRLNLVSGNWRS